jgi:hypothetical protein
VKKHPYILAVLAAALAFVGRGAAEPVLALTTTNQILRYDTTNVAAAPTQVSVSGLTGSETLLGFDFRPNDGRLYGVTDASRLYTINPTTGAAALVGTLSTPLNLAGTNTGIAFDFNPVPDRIRIIANRSGQNLRVNPNDATVTVDTTIPAYAAGDAFAGQIPQISAVGYTPSPSGVTTLFGFDDTTDRIVQITNPNGGVAVTRSGLGGLNGNQNSGFDVSPNTGIAYLSLDLGGGVFRLYTIDLTVNNPNTNSSTLVGTFNVPAGLTITDIAAVPEPGSLALCLVAATGVGRYLRRRYNT